MEKRVLIQNLNISYQKGLFMFKLVSTIPLYKKGFEWDANEGKLTQAGLTQPKPKRL
jgi:hypothetical protein